ncbi:MAG: Antitoxin [Belnapia sp.]|nr:Antitoxin [Belnapia sp.]
MAGWQDDADEPIRTVFPGDPAPGLEGLPRVDLAEVEALVPTLVDQAIRGPLVLTRHGQEAFVLLPLDAYRRLWATAPRPPVIDAGSYEAGSYRTGPAEAAPGRGPGRRRSRKARPMPEG